MAGHNGQRLRLLRRLKVVMVLNAGQWVGREAMRISTASTLSSARMRPRTERCLAKRRRSMSSISASIWTCTGFAPVA
ncbi:MAG: hypothetical protein DI607_14415 [Sphingomonas hengshuiensis]|nr:MAG: hypothetical protein DI607_14415 [Sphingomonas hengshuiensis]